MRLRPVLRIDRMGLSAARLERVATAAAITSRDRRAAMVSVNHEAEPAPQAETYAAPSAPPLVLIRGGR